MPLVDLRLQHFRSYTDASFDLSEGVNIIVGPNATGKTNLLEAVLLLARGKSYRAKDAELVQFGQDWARLDTHEPDGNVRTLKLQCPEGSAGAVAPPTAIQAHTLRTCKKTFEIEEKTYQRLSPQKSLPVVLFEPDHLLMLSGSPELRRSYMDELLEQLEPTFGTMRRQYKRVLTQRNALLKSSQKSGYRPPQSQLFVWNLRLGELAGAVVRERLRLITHINEVASAIYGTISGHTDTTVALQYVSAISTEDIAAYESAFMKRLEQTLERDLILGYTASGPHRDDFRVYLNGHASQEAASRGENRTIILALKVIELRLVEERAAGRPDGLGLSPILLLDDVFSELDGKRRHALTSYLQSYQTFITTTDADVVLKHFVDASNIIPTQR